MKQTGELFHLTYRPVIANSATPVGLYF
jgi:hypothetical protein